MTGCGGSRQYLSRRALGLPPFGIRRVYEEAVAMERQGVDVIHLELGRPDFDTPAHIKAAAIDAINRGQVHYTSNNGLLELREAVARKLERECGLEYDPKSEIFITAGGSEALNVTFAAILSDGDEMLLPVPCYSTYLNLPAFLGAEATAVVCLEEEGYQVDTERLERSVTPKTRAIMVNSPCNPTGAVWDRRTMEGLARVAREHDLLVISDEVYEYLVYDGARAVSPAALPGMRERTFILNSISKTYSATGWRIGYVAGPAHLMETALRVHQHNVASANTFAQWGALAALEGPQDEVFHMVKAFDERRRFLYGALSQIPGMKCNRPQGAFYMFPDISAYGVSSEELTMYLLKEAHVAVVHGSAFGDAGEGHIRISYASSLESLKAAVGRMADAIEKL
ncbi:MAG: pyridoxal phosphate-dependent aminotransferase [Bacillota bacterium]